LYTVIQASGIEAGLNHYDEWHEQYFDAPDYVFDFSEPQLNDLGYRLLSDGNAQEAVAVLGLNTLVYPQSYNVWDSFAEANLAVGDTTSAIEYYRMSISLNFFNGNAHAALARLGASYRETQTSRWTHLTNQ